MFKKTDINESASMNMQGAVRDKYVHLIGMGNAMHHPQRYFIIKPFSIMKQ